MDLVSSVVDGVLGSAAGKAFDAVAGAITGSSGAKTSASTVGESSVTGSTSSSATSSGSSSPSNSEFASILQGLISADAGGQVSEEQLFAGVVGERVTTLKGADLGEKYRTLLQQQEALYSSYEAASKAALKDMRAAGDITSEEADKIYSEAFFAAQLKDKPSAALFDGRGGVGDPTVAVDTQASAIAKAEEKIKAMEDGTLKFDTRSVDEAEATREELVQIYSASPTFSSQLNGTSVGAAASGVVSVADKSSAAATAEQLSAAAPDGKLSIAQLVALLPDGVSIDELELGDETGGGPYYKAGTAYSAGTVNDIPTERNNGHYDGGFLWKPVSDSSGNLCILAQAGPGQQYDVSTVVLKNQDGTVIEEGTHTDPEWGFHTTAGRKFNFTKQGGSYPDNLIVEVTLANGAKLKYKIPDTSQRWS